MLNKWLFGQEAIKRSAKLGDLHEIGLKIISSLDINDLITRVVEAGVYITNTDAGAIYLFDRDTNKLYEKAYKGPGEKNAKLVSSVIEEEIFRQILIDKKPVITNKNLHRITGFLTKSIIFFPLVSRGRALGILCVYNLKPDHKFTNEDLYYLSTIANYGAIAIDNAGMFFETEQRITKSLINFKGLRSVLKVIADEALRFLEADNVNLYKYDQKRGYVFLPPVRAGATNEPEIQQKKGEFHYVAAFYKLIKRGTPFYASEARDEWIQAGLYDEKLAKLNKGFIDREGIISSAGIPLIVDEETLGLLFVNYRTNIAFTPDHKKRIEYFANQASLAINIANIIEKSNDYLIQLRTLEDISQEIVSSIDIQLDQLLRLIFKAADKMLDASNFYVAIFNKETNSINFRLVIENGIEKKPEGEWASRIYGNGLTEYVMNHKEALIINSNIESWLKEHSINQIGALSKSWLGAPLILRDGVLGVVAIQNYVNEYAFDETHIHFLTTIANQASIAFENSLLFQRSESYNEQLDNLHELSASVLRGEGIKNILDKTAYAACELTGGDYAMILLKDTGEEDDMSVVGFYGKTLDRANLNHILGYKIKNGVGVTGIAARQKTPVIIDDVKENNMYIALLEDTRSEIAIPLTEYSVSGKVYGVINVESCHLKNFNNRHVDLLEGLATHVAIAIDNAQKIQELEQVHKRLKDSQSLAVIGLLYGEDLHLANNKLGAAQQFAINIMEVAEDLTKAREYAKKIEANISTILELIDEMKTTVNPPAPVSFNVQERITNSLEEFSFSKNVEVKVNIQLSNPVIIGYERQIGQVFRVVFYNAKNALNGEGALIIAASDFFEDGQNYIKVEISNTASEGINSKLGDHVFDFGQKRGSKKGFQMGLAWSRLFLQMTGGDINIVSSLNLTTVSILIPKNALKISQVLGNVV